MKDLKINLKNMLIVVCFFVLLLQQVMLKYSNNVIRPIISSVDEFITVIMMLSLLLKKYEVKERLNCMNRIMILAFGLFLSLGVISSLIYHIQPYKDSIIDFVVCSRFFVFYLWFRVFFGDYNYKKITNIMANGCKIITVITFVLAMHDEIMTPFFEKSDIRFGMYALQLFYPHASYMAISCFTCICVLAVQCAVLRARNNNIYIGLNIFMMILTLRTKAIASAFLCIILYYIIVHWNLKNKRVLYVLSSLGVLFFAKNQIVFYYGKNVIGGTRALLTSDALLLAKEYFPLGTGFGTFGSNIAAVDFSPLYVDLGYLNLEGGVNNAFLSDTFWPIVIAQSGFIGTLFFVVVVICLIKMCLELDGKSQILYWVSLSIMGYELISSTSETAFFNPAACILFAIMGASFNIVYENKQGIFCKKIRTL